MCGIIPHMKASSSRLHLIIVAAILALAVTLFLLARANDPTPDFQPLHAGGTYVGYLSPTQGSPPQIWLADVSRPSSHYPTRQFTRDEAGIFDYAVSPDGWRIAYVQPGEGSADIRLFDLRAGASLPLIECPEYGCSDPEWHPSGDLIAYERINFSIGASVSSRIDVWIADLRASSASVRPLFDDPTIVSSVPQWSPDGTRIAVGNWLEDRVIVYNFDTDESLSFSAAYGMGNFSSDGTRLLFAELVTDEGPAPFTRWHIGDLATGAVTAVSNAAGPLYDDNFPAWRPGMEQIAFARRAFATADPSQIVLLDLSDGSAAPITSDPAYTNSGTQWNADGTRLLIVRIPVNATTPEVWLYDFERDTLEQIAVDAYAPRWVELP